MNKKGISTGVLILILVLAVFAYSSNMLGLKDWLSGLGGGEPSGGTGTGETTKCPSSGLTEVTINSQKALATTATAAITDYYVYDGDVLVANGNSGTDGISTFDVGCGIGKTYKAKIINETRYVGYYGKDITLKADSATDTHNLQLYTFGMVKIDGITNSIQNVGDTSATWIGAGASSVGKICNFKITFHVNESTSAYYKPLIVCEANSTIITDLTLVGATAADSKVPSRLSPATGSAFHVYEIDTITTEQATLVLNGKLQFGSTAAKATDTNTKCRIIDQAEYKLADYKTLSMEEGWGYGAQNSETAADVGAEDSSQVTINIAGSNSTSGYCG